MTLHRVIEKPRHIPSIGMNIVNSIFKDKHIKRLTGGGQCNFL